VGISGPTPYQLEILNKLSEHKRISVRGPHGLGKSAMAAWIILWFALVHDGQDWKIPTTASAWRQLTHYLWPEIHKWSRFLKWELVGRPPFDMHTELEKENLKLKTGQAFALASDNAALLEGAHADHLLFLFDEAKEIPDATWDAAEGALSTGNCWALAISTPGEPQGRFYEIHKRKPGLEDWWVRHVTREETIAAGRMDKTWAANREKLWGKSSAVYQNRVLGEFASSGSDGVISLSWVERANQRWLAFNDRVLAGEADWGTLDRLGVDVGRGGDPTAMARRHGIRIRAIEHSEVADLMEVEGKMAGIMQGNPSAYAMIDIIGVGAGVYDRAREDPEINNRVIPFNASLPTKRRDRTNELGFSNLRSLGWWTLRELLQDDAIDLPPDDLLTGDLTSPKWKVMSGGKVQIEPKDDIKKRLGRSTNDGDAVMQAFVDVSNFVDDETLEAWGAGEALDVQTMGEDESKASIEEMEAYGSGMSVEEYRKWKKDIGI
jgi:hypothetical protein